LDFFIIVGFHGDTRFFLLLFFQEILDVLLLSLAHPRPAIRKRTAIAIGRNPYQCYPNRFIFTIFFFPLTHKGHLVKNLGDKPFAALISHLTAKLSSTTNVEFLRSYISTAATISRQVGKRLSKHLSELSPILTGFLEKSDDELREGTLQVHPVILLPFLPRVPALTSVLFFIQDTGVPDSAVPKRSHPPYPQGHEQEPGAHQV